MELNRWEIIVTFPGFSDVSEFKVRLYDHIKAFKKYLETQTPDDNESNPEKIILILAEIRLISLSFEDNLQNQKKIGNSLNLLNEDLLYNFWNNPHIIILFCVIMNVISSILEMIQRKSHIDRLVRQFQTIEFENLKKWSVTVENILTQTLPFIVYFSDDNGSPFLKKIINMCLEITTGNRELENWLDSLQSAYLKNIKTTITINQIPLKNDILEYEILWLFKKRKKNVVFSILKEKLKEIEHNGVIHSEKIKLIPDFIVKWICMEIFLSSLRVIVSNRYELLNKVLPFFELAPREFERLCYWIISLKPSKWKDVQWLGAAGGEKGKDILAKNAESDKYWVIQCKRVKQYGPKAFKTEFKKIYPEIQKLNAEGYLLYLARPASDNLRKVMSQESKNKGVIIQVYDKAKIDLIVKQNPFLLKEFFHKI